MKKTIFITSLVLLASLAVGKTAFAANSCDGIYGGGTNCGTNGFILKSQVANPNNTSQFVDNLGPNDAHYQPQGIVYFSLTVTNNTNSDLSGVTLTDNLPRFVTFQTATGNTKPNVSQNGTSVTINLNTVKKGQTTTVKLNGVIAKAENLPTDQNPVCVVNMAQANAQNGQGTQASSQFCIEKSQTFPTQIPAQGQSQTKGGQPVANQAQPTVAPQKTGAGQGTNQNQNTGNQNSGNNQANAPVFPPAANAQQTPKSGPEALPLLAMIPTGAIGMWLRKKAK